jgi:SAM-dependent methyltransferase
LPEKALHQSIFFRTAFLFNYMEFADMSELCSSFIKQYISYYVRLANTLPYPKAVKTFLYDDAVAINIARLVHLESLDLQIANKSVLEVGSGIGLLTKFFEDKNCNIISTEGRLENIQVNLAAHPHRHNRVIRCDLTEPHSHDFIGSVDIVFCYGTLYHVYNPEVVIKDLARVTKDMLLIETCVFWMDNGQINPDTEDVRTINQAICATGCRPGRDWVFFSLKEYFPYVYVTATQPEHRDFAMSWPAPNDGNLKRSIFIASRNSISAPLLLDFLPEKQKKNV